MKKIIFTWLSGFILLTGCGLNNTSENSNTAIYGGDPVTTQEFNSVVAVTTLFRNKHQPVCTGTLVKPTLVITAAHCIEFLKNRRSYELNARIYIGNGHDTEPTQGQYEIESMVISPEYQNHPISRNDIAYIKLKTPVTEEISYPILPLSRELIVASQKHLPATVVGFGEREDSSLGSKFKVTTLRNNYFTPYDRFIGGEGKDSCQGDSGGPAFGKYKGKKFLLALSSEGDVCGHGGIYTNVAPHLCWVEKDSQINLNPDDSKSCNEVITSEVIKTNEFRDFLGVCLDSNATLAQQETIDTILLKLNVRKVKESDYKNISARLLTCLKAYRKIYYKKELDLSGTFISDITPLAHLPHLKKLNLAGNKITDISTINSLENLQYLDITANNISNLEILEQNKKLQITGQRLQFHNFWKTNFYDLCLEKDTVEPLVNRTLSRIASVIQMSLSRNACEDISRNLTWRRSLNLSNRGVAEVTPLSGLINLVDLNLAGNTELEDIAPLSTLFKLKNLNVKGTNVVDFSALNNLTQLQIQIDEN